MLTGVKVSEAAYPSQVRTEKDMAADNMHKAESRLKTDLSRLFLIGLLLHKDMKMYPYGFFTDIEAQSIIDMIQVWIRRIL